MKPDSKAADPDKVFSALADKNRRKLIELLHQGDSTLMELSGFFPDISFQALSKHIKILESAQLISKRRQGKYKILSLNRASLEQSLAWISFYANFWKESFDQLEENIQKHKAQDDTA